MWNDANPTTLYLGTTWELISSNKYIKSGSTALQMGGSNIVTINKNNLPNIKLNTTPLTATIGTHFHYLYANETSGSMNQHSQSINSNQHARRSAFSNDWFESYNIAGTSTIATVGRSSNSGSGTTGSFSPQTESLGSGIALSIQPEYITLKFWKRLS